MLSADDKNPTPDPLKLGLEWVTEFMAARLLDEGRLNDVFGGDG
jgi:hypothetical protein